MSYTKRELIAFRVSVVLLNLGVLLLAWFISPVQWGKPQPFQATFFDQQPVLKPTAKKPVIISGRPTRVALPGRGIDLPVVDGYYNPGDSSWTLGMDAYFATPTSLVNNIAGTTLIYGHNNKDVFGPLLHITAGETLSVYTDTGYVFEYVYSSSHLTDPADTSIFSYSGPPTVTLQTCSGNWSENRSLYTFNFVSYQKL